MQAEIHLKINQRKRKVCQEKKFYRGYLNIENEWEKVKKYLQEHLIFEK